MKPRIAALALAAAALAGVSTGFAQTTARIATAPGAVVTPGQLDLVFTLSGPGIPSATPAAIINRTTKLI